MSQQFVAPPRYEGDKCIVEVVATSPNVKFNTTKFLDDLDHKQRQMLSKFIGGNSSNLRTSIEQDITDNQAKLVMYFMDTYKLELTNYLKEVDNG